MAIELDPVAGPDGGAESRRLAKYWIDQIQAVIDNSEMKRFNKRGEQIIKRYRDERYRVTNEDGARRYSSLWSNVEILKPALYGRTPIPIAERRFKDKDPTGRGAAQILERALRNEIEICGYHEALSQAVNDYLLPGRGIVWVRYEPQIAEGISLPLEPETDMRDSMGGIPSRSDDSERQENTTPKGRLRPKLMEADDSHDEVHSQDEVTEKLESTNDRVVRESTPVDYIPWDDFMYFPVRARTWNEVTAIAKRVYMSRDQLIRRFGKKIGKAIPMQRDNRGNKTQNTTLQASDQDKGEVFEIWSKDDQRVYWASLGYDYLCDRKEDPLNLENFWPVPRPLFANPTNNTLIPVPDYIQYEDQAIQIDECTQRIAMLTKAAKITGVYNAAAKDIQRMFQESVENELIPVDDWAAFAEEGGVAGNISFLPLKDIIGLLNELVTVKQKLLEDMDRLTGINDIMRGTSDARETLGGVRLKSNSTGTRLTQRQNEVARMARDTIRIMADIMCQHFSPQSMIEASGALYEEGLGPEDMPPLSALAPPPSGAPPQAGPMGAAPPQMVARPPGPPQVPGAPPQAPGMAPPPGPQNGPPVGPPPQAAPVPGSNVVPLRPQMPPGAPPGPMQGPPPPLNGQILPPQPPIPPEVLAKLQALHRISRALGLLRDERLRGFRVDIEVDSTIFPDAAQDKQDRTEFVVAVTGYLEKALMIGAQMPEVVPLLGKLLQFGVRAHRVGRDLENAIEEFADEAVVAAKKREAMAAQQPNPEQIKLQAEQVKAQGAAQTQQLRNQSDLIKNQADIRQSQIQQAGDAQSAQAEVAKAKIDAQAEANKAQQDSLQRQFDAKMREMEVLMEQMRMQFELKKLDREEDVHQAQTEANQAKADAAKRKAKAGPTGS